MNAEQRYILIAEDDPDDQHTFSESFTRLNPNVPLKIVKDGQELLDFLDSCPNYRLPAVIILDYKMPKLSGADVLRYLATCHRFNNIPKIVWSTSTRENDRAECLQLGAAGYFIKPATNQELEDIIAGINIIFYQGSRKVLE